MIATRVLFRQKVADNWSSKPVQYGAQFSAIFDVNLYFFPQTASQRNLKFLPELASSCSFFVVMLSIGQ